MGETRWWLFYMIIINVVCCQNIIGARRFGYNDRYTCHCDGGDCQGDTGICTSGNCQKGWYGSSCQKENVALNKSTWQSSTYNASNALGLSEYAVDGDINHSKEYNRCTHTDVGRTHALWGVDLKGNYPIENIKIYARNYHIGYRFAGFRLFVDEHNKTKESPCRPEDGYNNTVDGFMVNCNSVGRYVTITNNKSTIETDVFVNLCEVEVYVCSIGTFGPDCSSLCYCQSPNDRCDKVTGQCPNGCAGEYTGISCNIKCNPNINYGENCNKLCKDRNCLGPSSCDVKYGKCEGGCKAGWSGDDCIQGEETRFGYDERYTCHCNGGLCDLNTGHCSIGQCEKGWYGSSCQKENVALNKGVGQSSTYSDDDGIRYARYAVDGDTYHDSGYERCSHTAGGTELAFWFVDMNHSYPVTDIQIYLRETHYKRLEGFKVFIDETNRAKTPCNLQNKPTVAPVFTIRCNNIGRYLTISNNVHKYEDEVFVNLCEVEVYVCSIGTFGPDCSSLCYCQSPNDRCDKVTGQCPNGCAGEYTGISCNIKCNQSINYGENCNELCRDRNCLISSSSCDIKNGTCKGGCQPGWKGDDCKQKCNNQESTDRNIEPTYGQNCSNNCWLRHCFNSKSLCNHITGECDQGCTAGYQGGDCTQGCNQSINYGENCSELCKDRNCLHVESSSCDQKYGTCDGGCKPGWKGTDCKQKCNERESDGNGYDTYGLNCSKYCHGRHCSGSKSSCDHVTGKCDQGCTAGYKGDDCTQDCNQDINYGENCNRSCNSRKCLSNSPCDKMKGKCEGGCQPGWQGEDCTLGCNQNINYGENCSELCKDRNCLHVKSSSCDVKYGKCDGGCKPGWMGTDCKQKCNDGGFRNRTSGIYRYGKDCSKECKSRHCRRPSPCDHVTGECDRGCSAGYQGGDCTQECNQSINYGENCNKLCRDRNCLISSSSCDIKNGNCKGGCQHGWKGDDCKQKCNDGKFRSGNPYGIYKYGKDCSKECKSRHCRHLSPCDHVTGECDQGCSAGYQGGDCTQECNKTRNYGEDCNKLCSDRNCLISTSSCDIKDGTCEGGCNPGWKGDDCRQKCNDGHFSSQASHGQYKYGKDCSKDCKSRHCVNSSSCDYVTGRCDGGCQVGYQGNDCVQECNQSINYGENCSKFCSDRNCLESSSCDVKYGTCDRGCKPGWKGTDCRQRCNYDRTNDGVYYGNYGDGCSKRCTMRHCLTRYSTCNHVTGGCDQGCATGYQGDDCTQECQTGYYGDYCKQLCVNRKCRIRNTECNHTHGSCNEDCLPGYKGLDCSRDCEESYGEDCQYACNARKCAISSDCPKQNGSCSGGCSPGYQGIDCRDECYNRTYGLDCKLNCDDRNCVDNTDCNIIDGRCIGLCSEGFELKDCTQKIQTLAAGSIAGILSAVVLVVVIAVIIILYRRRKTADQLTTKPVTESINDGNHDVPVNDADPVYENSAMLAIELATVTKYEDSSKDPLSTKAINKQKQKKQRENTFSNSTEQDPGSDYYNLQPTIPINRISVVYLQDVLTKLNSNESTFTDMFQGLPSEFTATYDDSQIEENRAKNRYRGYYPYDYNRVMLSEVGNDTHSNYINASYVDSYKQNQFFIAAQGPTQVTINDFIRMIFEEKVVKVVMLTNLVEAGKYKCERYWPETGREVFGNLELILHDEIRRASYTTRRVILKHLKTGKEHQTMLFHFTAWADHGVPEVGDLLDYLYRVQEYKSDSKSPTLVHCSAGIGRTGTFIAIDALLKEGNTTGSIDVLQFIKTMRGQRKGMIQTANQLKFVYEAVVEAFKYGKTSTAVLEYDIIPGKSKKFHLTKFSRNKELQLLKGMINEADKNRIYVPGKPQLDIHSASSWKKTIGYIISDIKGHDMESLWNLIRGQESSVAVVLTNGQNQDSVCPFSATHEIIGKMTISSKVESLPTDELEILTVTTYKQKIQHVCKMIILKTGGEYGLEQLESDIVELIRITDQYDSTSHPVTVVYSDMKHAAIFCIVRNILERIKLDNDVEIFNTTKKVLQSLNGGINQTDEYDLIYKMASEQLSSVNIYENV